MRQLVYHVENGVDVMRNNDCNAGVFIIVNEVIDKIYYFGAEQLHSEIIEHSKLLKQGLHINSQLQNDYNIQCGNGFSIKIISQRIDMRSVQEILKILLNLDDLAYNHEKHTEK